ncbi:hypothetical protein ACFPVY_00525 [Flavobacterium qiangtangense]|uniref:Lipoprotein n=1 Tax=Flavobacterium qiangtangense TaxID=1442595 RepID=A0ABW1PIZ0_9FLAO
MKNRIYILMLLISLVSCSKEKDAVVENNAVKIDSIVPIKTIAPTVKADDDCVFDNNPQELTKEWLKDVGIKKFSWDQKNNKAIVIQNQDTLLLYKGGCNHLTSSLEFKFENKNEADFDSRLLQKISEVVCKFQFENYCTKINNNQFEKIKSNDMSYLLDFEDDDPEDNLIYNGIEIKSQANKVYITISEYYN